MKSLNFSHYLLTFVGITETISTNGVFILFNLLSLTLFFSQPLSYLFKLPINFNDDKISFINTIIYYSNFSNFLTIPQSFLLTIIFYIILISSITFFMLFWILLSFISQKHEHHKLKTLLNRVSFVFKWMFLVFNRFFLIPSLDVLINPLFCLGVDGFVDCKDKFSFPFAIVSIFYILLIILLSWIYLFFGRSFSFNDVNNINFPYNLTYLWIFIFRIIIPLIFPILNSSFPVFFYAIFILLMIFLFVEYLHALPFRNNRFNEIYGILLFSTILYLFLTISFDFFSFITDYSMFYILLLLVIMAIKSGQVLSFRKYFIILTQPNQKNLEFSLEEVDQLFLKHQDDKISRFNFYGILRNHKKTCQDKKCRFNSANLEKFFLANYFQKEHIINVFITQGLYFLITQKEFINNETLILKYVSFLLDSKITPYKAYFEFQKTKQLSMKKTMYQEIMQKYVKKKLGDKIKELAKAHLINTNRKNSQKNETMETSTFFDLSQQGERFYNLAMELFQHKLKVLENYKQGFSSYDEILSVLSNFFNKTNEYKKNLDNYQHSNNNIFYLKYSSLYSCIIFNNLKSANQSEDEFENLKKKHSKSEGTDLTPLIFLNTNLVTCQASFLNIEGRILESSKTEKFARFFNYSYSELRGLNKVADLMPSMLGDNHRHFMQWRLKREWNSEILKNDLIESFGIEKNGFIFPIKIFTGFDLRDPDDFVLYAGLMKLPNFGEGVYFEKSGAVIGVTEGFFRIFHEINQQIKLEGLESLNVFNLIEGLKQIINLHFEQDKNYELAISNNSGNIVVPENIKEIIEVLLLKKTEIVVDNKSSERIASGKSLRSFTKTLNSKSSKITEKSINTTKISKFLAKSTIGSTLKNKKDLILKIFQENYSDETIFREMSENYPARKQKFSYDLSIKNLRYGKNEENVLRTIWLRITQSPEEILQESFDVKGDTNNNNTYGANTLGASCLSDIPIKMPPVNVAELDFCFDRNVNYSLTYSEQPKLVVTSMDFDPSIERKIEKVENVVTSNNLPVSHYIEKVLQVNEKKEYTSVDHFDENLEKITAKGSSVSSLKASFGIFRDLLQIQRNYPKNILGIIFLLAFQGMLLLSYSIFMYYQTTLYVSQTYLPLQTANINQIRINIAFCTATILSMEYEYYLQNITAVGDFHLKIFNEMLNTTFYQVRDLFYNERKIRYDFDFGSYVESLYAQFANQGTVSKILFTDLSDIFLQTINYILNSNLDSLLIDKLKILPRNLPYFVTNSRKLRDQIQNEFLTSNNIVTNNLLIFLCATLVIISLLKFLEFYIFYLFQAKISKLLNIFLRMTPREVEREWVFQKRMISLLKDSNKSFLSENFPEKILRKNSIKIDEDTLSSFQISKKFMKESAKNVKTKKKAIKKVSLFNIQPLSRARILSYLLIIFMIPFAFYIGTYFYWIMTNNNISNLLGINAIFNTLYTYSTTSLVYNNLLIREKLFRDSEYEISNEFYQNHTNRMNYFYSNTITRMATLKTYLKDLPQYGIYAEEYIKDVKFDQIMQGDTCSALLTGGYLNPNEELTFCENAFNQAFQNGLLSIMNEFILAINTENFLNLKEDSVAISNVKSYLKSKEHPDVIVGAYYMSTTLNWFYKYLVGYYLTMLDGDLGNLKMVVWIICVLANLILLGFGIKSYQTMKKMYDVACGSLGLLPYEKLVDDEQTIFLIKKYCKENYK